ncbi:hypothetical protein CORMATOL_02397 [Corynebacterium matruchotii ATCC 33806]|uniref:Uncharacterized protein n=1 Tax=Corynebacterium matruchotii ATCC 33806 TaxID=566549 RepID=C0E5W4_9CORY|nr:hypothetical protein CORMATOL_02397 [Corynebacterium matruchotii ATCC 33806]
MGRNPGRTQYQLPCFCQPARTFINRTIFLLQFSYPHFLELVELGDAPPGHPPATRHLQAA